MPDLTRQLPSGDNNHSFSSDDCFIAVMGLTGTGKSTFISLLMENQGAVEVGHRLNSCTAEVRPYSFIHKDGRRVYVLDTPGFDDTSRTDTEILKDVAYYLSLTYKQKIYLNGIIYLHRITDVRMTGSGVKNLNMFKALCGSDVYERVALVTTMWGNLVDPAVGDSRERDLLENPAWWGLMHQRGSRVVRHDGSEESASEIVSLLMGNKADVVLNIQKELVDDGHSLDTTEAGKAVEHDLQEAKKRFQSEKRDLEEQHAQALRDRDFALADTLEQQRQDYDSKLQQAIQAQADLKIDLQRLEQEKREEIQKLQENAAQQALDLERITHERQTQLDLLRQQSFEEQSTLRAEIAKLKAQADDAEANDTRRLGEIRRMENKLVEQEENFRRREKALSADLASATKRRGVWMLILRSLASLGLVTATVVTGDTGGISELFGGS